jgi:hypothetical protein
MPPRSGKLSTGTEVTATRDGVELEKIGPSEAQQPPAVVALFVGVVVRDEVGEPGVILLLGGQLALLEDAAQTDLGRLATRDDR